MWRAAQFWRLILVLLCIPGLGQQGSPKAEDFVFEVQPRIITAGESAMLRWSIKGATKVVIEEASAEGRDLRKLGSFGGSGTLRVTPKENTTYVLTCEGSTTKTCASVTIRVQVRRAK